MLDLILPSMALAQEVTPPKQEEIIAFLEAIGGWKTLGTLGVVMIVVQALLLFVIRPGLIKIEGKWKLVLVQGLTLIFGVASLIAVSGLSLGEALLHSQTLVAFQVLIHNIWKQFVKPKDG